MNESETQLLAEEPRAPGRLLLPSLVISYFATRPPTVVVGLLLIEIGLTFDRSVGVTGQIQTAASLVGALSALLMGVWSVRFNHKSLLLLGLLVCSISAIGCILSLNFTMLLFAFSISGLGLAMVGPMAFAFVGEHFPPEKQVSVIGYINAGISLAFIIGAPVISFITGIGGWRWAFLGYVLPVPLLSLAIAAKGVPSPSLSSSRSHQSTRSKVNYLEGFKEVFSNRSAMACLVGSAFSFAAFSVVMVYSISFFRERFLISIEFSSTLIIGLSLSFTLGSLIIGRFVTRFGRKPLTVVTAVVMGIFISSYMNVPNFWLSLTLSCLGALFFGMMSTTSTSLTLEQVPRFRGTMMSINIAAYRMGEAIGAGFGGLTLLLFDYEILGISLGAMGIAAAFVFYLLVNDPTKTRIHTSET